MIMGHSSNGNNSRHEEADDKMFRKIIAVLLVAITLTAIFAIPADAATTSSGLSKRTITVTTKANWLMPGSESITLKQTKGTFSYTKSNGKTTTKTGYATWKITVSATDGSHSYTKTWNDGSIKLSLKRNKTYTITITYDNQYWEPNMMLKYSHFKWTKYPTWKVSSTNKVSSCY